MGYSKYALSSVFCTWAVMLIVVLFPVFYRQSLGSVEFCLLLIMISSLIVFALKMIKIMRSPIISIAESAQFLPPEYDFCMPLHEQYQGLPLAAGPEELIALIRSAPAALISTEHPYLFEGIRKFHRRWFQVFTLMHQCGRVDVANAYRAYLSAHPA